MEIDKKELEKILARQADRVSEESDERMERYIGSLKEDFDHKMDAVMEYVKDVPKMKEKLDVVFDQVGQLTEDRTIVKEIVKDHERRLQKLETR